jgi:hypothetical protein
MAHAAKLVNPTPFDVEINYDRGVDLQIPAFGSVDLNLQQMHDFQPQRPGAETVQEVTHYHGLFLLDTDRPYENQALDALRRSHRRKTARCNEITQGHRDRAARQALNIPEETFKQVEEQMGIHHLRREIEALEKLIKKYEAVVVGDETTKKRHQLDPERTIFALNPPREFDSVITREFFLDENPEVAEQEKMIRAKMEVSDVGAD